MLELLARQTANTRQILRYKTAYHAALKLHFWHQVQYYRAKILHHLREDIDILEQIHTLKALQDMGVNCSYSNNNILITA